MPIQHIKNFLDRNQKWTPIAFFVLGFAFDAIMLRRIDELFTLLQQAAYILVCFSLVGVEIAELVGHFEPPKILNKVWKYREWVLHFLMGTLLNAYTIFYFKSASALTSFIFVLLLVGLLIVNEFKRFGKSQTKVHVVFLSLCLISYLVCLAPIVLGFMGPVPFLAAAVVAFGGIYAFAKILIKIFPQSFNLMKDTVFFPGLITQMVFVVLYFLHVIPPVPLSVRYLGIFHEITKTENEFQLSYSRPAWKFWQHGDQTFAARPGDAIQCYARIFSPTRFKDKLQIRWLFHDPRQGWISSDAIPVAVSGGREEGYRIVTKKSNYEPGDWRVQVETTDGRELGRIGFTVVNDEEGAEREYKIRVD